MSVHEIKRVSLMDVPAKLRELADQVERAGLKTAIVILPKADGKVAIRGFGERTSALEATGWLQRAVHDMTCELHVGGEESWPDGA